MITIEYESEGFDFSKLSGFTDTGEPPEKTARGIYLMISLPDELLFARNGTKVIMTFFTN